MQIKFNFGSKKKQAAAKAKAEKALQLEVIDAWIIIQSLEKEVAEWESHFAECGGLIDGRTRAHLNTLRTERAQLQAAYDWVFEHPIEAVAAFI